MHRKVLISLILASFFTMQASQIGALGSEHPSHLAVAFAARYNKLASVNSTEHTLTLRRCTDRPRQMCEFSLNSTMSVLVRGEYNGEIPKNIEIDYRIPATNPNATRQFLDALAVFMALLAPRSTSESRGDTIRALLQSLFSAPGAPRESQSFTLGGGRYRMMQPEMGYLRVTIERTY